MPATHSQPSIRAGDGEARLLVSRETDGVVVISLEGEWDMANADVFTEQIEQVLDDQKHLILDLSHATFIDSSTIHTLVKTHEAASKQRQAVVLQLATAANVERILEVSGIDQLIPRASSRTEAIETIDQFAKTKGHNRTSE
jgi:anti-sigma B factor antagonist